MNSTNYKLTQYAAGAGCGCKISPQQLKEILGDNFIENPFQNLILGNQSNDDAAVYKINENQVLISTTDFFTPIVDDAYTFGCVAAANALSDVYAMGAQPLMALAVLIWPINKLPGQVANQVIEGAKKICADAGIPLAGGHSVESKEPIFGLCVNGIAPINGFKKNNTAQEGDLLFLTKAIGTGILSNAMKKEILKPEDERELIQQLTTVNIFGKELGNCSYVTALTDVTGFGLLGHLCEMTQGNELCAEISFDAIPKINNIDDYLQQNCLPDATFRNWNAYSHQLEIDSKVDSTKAFQLLPDPQTNGGLLIAVKKNDVQQFKNLLKQHHLDKFSEPIGHFIKYPGKSVKIIN